LVLSGLLATNQRWLGAETYGVMGCFGLLLPVLPRLRVRIRTRLAQRLIRAFTLAVLPPLLVLGGVTNAVMHRALRGQVFAGNAALTRGSAAFVRQYVQDGQAAALMVARTPALIRAATTWDLPSLEAEMRVLYEEGGLSRSIWLLDTQGIVRATHPRNPKILGSNLASMSWFSQAVRYRLSGMGQVLRSDLAGRPLVVPFAVPIEDAAHHLLAVLVTVIDLRGLSERLRSMQVGHLGQLHLVDEAGRIIGHPDPARLGLPMDEDDLGARQALAGHSGVVEVPERQQLVAYEYVPDLGWALVTELPIQEAYQPLTRMTVVFLLLLVAVALATIGVASFISLRITDPLLTLQETVRAFSTGDLSRRSALVTGDELEDLAQGFDRMAYELQRLVEKLTASERSLHRANSELLAVLDSVNSAVLVFDHGRRIRYCNSRIESVLGLAPSEVLGQPAELIPTALTPRLTAPEVFRARLSRLADHPQERSQAELVLKEPWGVLIHFSSPVFLAETILGRVDVYDDITALRELERLKNEFLLLISHEFRTPLTFAALNMEMALRLLRARGGTPPEILRRLELAREGERRLIFMVEELLDVAAIDAGQLTLYREELSLPAIVQEALQRLRPRLQSHPVVLELPADCPPISGDRRRITQVVINFLSNAAQYTPEGARILVRLERQADTVIFSVTDRGAGLTPEELARLFDRFHRAQEFVGQAKAGLGLGLFLNKAFIEAHQGRLWVETQQGEGTTFAFSLPVNPPHKEGSSPTALPRSV
jgi:signal transduction histidine kinase/HAMP domain-containing protein